jgi:hypothetical protein
MPLCERHTPLDRPCRSPPVGRPLVTSVHPAKAVPCPALVAPGATGGDPGRDWPAPSSAPAPPAIPAHATPAQAGPPSASPASATPARPPSTAPTNAGSPYANARSSDTNAWPSDCGETAPSDGAPAKPAANSHAASSTEAATSPKPAATAPQTSAASCSIRIRRQRQQECADRDAADDRQCLSSHDTIPLYWVAAACFGQFSTNVRLLQLANRIEHRSSVLSSNWTKQRDADDDDGRRGRNQFDKDQGFGIRCRGPVELLRP